MSYPGTPSSVRNFTKGKIKLKLGDQVDGIVTFPKLIDLSKSFTIKNGRDRVEFKFTDAQIKALAPAPPAANYDGSKAAGSRRTRPSPLPSY